MKYIIGGGVAGLVTAYYLKDHKIIDTNIMGQMNSSFPLGPQLLQSDKYIQPLLKDLNIEYIEETALIGYEFLNDFGMTITQKEQPKDFRRSYTLRTRMTVSTEDSFMSENKKEIKHLVSRKDEKIYKTVLEKILEYISLDRIINSNVISIDIQNKSMTLFNGEKIEYEELISTIPINIFIHLANIQDDFRNYDFELLNKSFYYCSIDQSYDKQLAKNFYYIYSIADKYSRKTYHNYEKNIIYELTNSKCDGFFIDGNKIIDKVEDIKIQQKTSYNFKNVSGVEMVGNLAQWNHSIKINQVIKRVLELSV